MLKVLVLIENVSKEMPTWLSQIMPSTLSLSIYLIYLVLLLSLGVESIDSVDEERS